MGIMNSCLPDGQVRSWGSGSRRPGPGPQGLLPDSRVPCSEEAFIPNPGDPPGRLAPGPSLRPGSEVSTLSLSRRRPCPFHRGLGGAGEQEPLCSADSKTEGSCFPKEQKQQGHRTAWRKVAVGAESRGGPRPSAVAPEGWGHQGPGRPPPSTLDRILLGPRIQEGPLNSALPFHARKY
ncbi:translation initiation factor IF-2-like isoform X1 [Monodelphis domestica]|uniref:translation initiation factor IF-2-like isoform X1 n=1 Tax=Monodelphis domestica TaxID=13616 RepID=UPI0024E19860|nr:translation initiation factor IF-2-like isoform X1 [Monodelphis domestica]